MEMSEDLCQCNELKQVWLHSHIQSRDDIVVVSLACIALVTVLNHSLFQKDDNGFVARTNHNNSTQPTSPSSRGQLGLSNAA